MPEFKNRVIIGGGFAGIAAAWWAAQQQPPAPVILLEKEAAPLKWLEQARGGPVIIGRLDSPAGWGADLYPRGWPQVERILEKWPAAANRDWLESLGVVPVTDAAGAFHAADAAALRGALVAALGRCGVEIRTGYAVETIAVQPDGGFRVWSRDGQACEAGRLVLATGGERNHGLKLAHELGAETAPPLAAYLRLRLASPKLGERLGPWTCPVRLRCPKSGLKAEGMATVSPRGLEGPAVSALSAQLCQTWAQMGHRFQLEVDWLAQTAAAAVRNHLSTRTQRGGRRAIGEDPQFGLDPKQWQEFLRAARIDAGLPWPRIKPKQIQALTQRLKGDLLAVDGMGLPAGERAWAGGVALDGIDCGTGQSLRVPGLHFAGELLDFLGLPGGAHLNAVWASGCLAGVAVWNSSK